MTDTPRDELLAKNLPYIALVVVAIGSTVARLRFGWPSVLLWLAFCALSGAILLYWESLRSALDPESHGDDNDLDHRVQAQAELEERKRAAVRALRDVREEHALGKLSDEDFRELEARYRGEARAVMQALDDLLGDHLARAEAEFDKIAGEINAKSEPKPAAQDESPASKPAQEREKGDSIEKSEKLADLPAAAPIASERVNACKSCETVNDADARFCKKCGEKMEGAAS